MSSFNIIKTVTLLVHAGLFWCFHNSSISYMDYNFFNVRMGTFFYRIHGGPRFISVRIDVYVWCCWGLYCAIQINMYHVLSPNWSPLRESKEQGNKKSKQSHKPATKPTRTPKGSFYANTTVLNVHPFTLYMQKR